MNRLRATLLILAPLVLLLIVVIGPFGATAAHVAQSTGMPYRVLQGDTLYGIALKYDVGLDALMAANNLASPTRIRLGMTLMIPVPTRVASPSIAPASLPVATPAAVVIRATEPPAEPAAAPASESGATSQYAVSRSAGSCGATYTVGAGDTLTLIGLACGISGWDLANLNGIDYQQGLIYVGQVLKLTGVPSPSVQQAVVSSPAQAAPAAARYCSEPYQVEVGDSLSAIGLLCGVSVANLMAWNGLASDAIWSGQWLHTVWTEVAPAPSQAYVPVQPTEDSGPVGRGAPPPVDTAVPQPPPAPTPQPADPPLELPEPTVQPPATQAPVPTAAPTYSLNPTIEP